MVNSNATLHIPEGGGPWPGVVVFPDGYGARETIRQIESRVADMGYVALVPDIYYRAGRLGPVRPGHRVHRSGGTGSVVRLHGDAHQ